MKTNYQQMIAKHRSFLGITILTIIIVAVILYSSFTGQSLARRYAPLQDAAMEIKLEAALAHLWFEEIISGDRSVTIKEVWKHLDQAEWYARAMLEGGENPEGKFVPLTDNTLRHTIEQTQEGISAFRTIAHERWNVRTESGLGSDIDQRFDKIFEDFLASADEVESALQQAMERYLQQFRFLQILLIVITIILGMVLGIIIQRHNDRRERDMLALQNQEENLRTTLYSIGDAVIATDTSGLITRMNPEAVKLTGCAIDDALGKLLTEVFNIVNAKTGKKADNPVNKVLESGKIVGLANHTMLISKDGSEYQIADSGSPIKDNEGKITGVVLVFRDVTEEYRRQEDLREKDFIINSSLSVIATASLDGKMTYVNPSFLKVWGFSNPDEVIGRPFSEFWMVSDQLDDIMAALQGKEGKWNGEIQAKKKDGSIFYVYVSAAAIIDDAGKLIGLTSTSSDITERKQAEEALKKSEQFLRESQKVAEIGSYVLDISSGIWQSTAILDELFGIDIKYNKDISGWLQIVHPEDQAEMQDYFATNVLTNHESFNRDYRIKKINNQHEHWVHGKGELEFGEDGNPIKMIGTIQDITERKQAEEALKQSLLEKQNLLNEVHHRVKNNLQIIISLYDLAKTQLTDQLAIALLEDNAEKIHSIALVHNMLYRSNRFDRISLNDYLIEMMEHIAGVYGAGQDIKYGVAGDEVALGLNRAVPLGMVMSELIINAYKHGFKEQDRGAIRIKMRKDTATGNYLIAINNDGDPIDPDRDPFTSGSSTGLQLCRTIIELQMSGALRLATAKTTEFQIEIPIQRKK